LTTTTLAKFNAAKHALAEARSIDEVKDIRDKAEALRLYSIQQRESFGMQNDIAEIKIRAERRIGEMIPEMQERGELAKQGRQEQTSDDRRFKLDELGMAQNTLSVWENTTNINAKNDDNSCIPKIDVRVTIPKSEHEKIIARVEDGETRGG